MNRRGAERSAGRRTDGTTVLDTLTVVVLVVLSTAMVAVGCAVSWLYHRSFLPLRDWAVSSTLVLPAMLLLAFHEADSAAPVAMAAHIIVFMAFASSWSAVSRLVGRPPPVTACAVAAALYLPAIAVAIFVIPDFERQMAVTSFLGVVVAGGMGGDLLLDPLLRRRRSGQAMILLFGQFALFSLVRGLLLMVEEGRPLAMGVLRPLAFVEVMIFVLGGGLYMIVMAHERTVSRLRRLAERDELTGLLNRRAFLDAAEAAVERARRGGHQLAMVLLDLDHFKRINDEHGHLTGDHALRLAAETVMATLRSADAVGRYGGEEFCLLLPGTDAGAAEAIAERIRRSVATVRIDTPGGPLRLTASFGVAALGPEVTTVHELLVRADAALYTAKERGRDRVVVAPAGNSGAAFAQQLVAEP